MMLNSLNSAAQNGLQGLQQSVFDALTTQQIRMAAVVAAVVAIALSFLGIVYLAYRQLSLHNVNKIQTPKVDPSKIPNVDKAAIQAHAAGIKTFSFEMLKAINSKTEKQKNILISPLSVSLVLSMIKHGLSSEQQLELEKVAHLPHNEEELKGCAYRLMVALKEAGFHMANLVYLNNQYRLNPDYQSNVSGAYQSQVLSGTSAEDINAWVKDVTQGKIEQIVDQKDLLDFFVALVNAIHFKALWANPFKPDLTAEGDFHPTKTESIKTQMMHGKKDLDYFENETCQAVKMHYRGSSKASMLVVLPKDGYTPADIDQSAFGKIMANLENESVKLSMPKFDLKHEVEIIGTLKTLGIKGIFGVSDFTPLVDLSHEPSKEQAKKLFVGTMKQKSTLTINEEKTEAAVATVAVVKAESAVFMPKMSKEMVVDRPFMAILMHEETPVLFGIIQNPKS